MEGRTVPHSGDLTAWRGPALASPGVQCPSSAGPSMAGLYLIGALRPDQSSSYERHLLHCPACQTYCDGLAPAVDALAVVRGAGEPNDGLFS